MQLSFRNISLFMVCEMHLELKNLRELPACKRVTRQPNEEEKLQYRTSASNMHTRRLKIRLYISNLNEECSYVSKLSIAMKNVPIVI